MDEAIDYKQYTTSQLRQMTIEIKSSKKTVKVKKTWTNRFIGNQLIRNYKWNSFTIFDFFLQMLN